MTNEYGKLIQRVRKVNRKAAIFMARQLPLLKRRGFHISLVSPESTKLFSAAFLWAATPQGFKYWESVAEQLGE